MGAFAPGLSAALLRYQPPFAGGVSQTQAAWNAQRVSVRDFGAYGDGTDQTTQIGNARAALTAGGSLYFPEGLYVIGLDAALAIAVAGLAIYGDGASTVLMAKAGAALTSIVTVLGTASGFALRDLVLDGNRANGGINPSYFALNLTGSDADIENVEVRYAPGVAVFIGSSTAVQSSFRFKTCWVHDNGGVTNSAGIGVGIQSGGAFLPDDISVEGSRFENNYNTILLPGQSAALNLTATSVRVTNCFFKNNYNVSGGQVALASNTTDGSADGALIVTENVIVQTGTFGGDLTCGVEIDGRKFVASHNVILGVTADGVRIESTGGDGTVDHNIISCGAAGVALIASGGTGIRKTLVDANNILSAATGVSVQAGATVSGDIVTNNLIDASVATKIAGAANCAVIRNNTGYSPAIATGQVAGASPYAWPVLNYDAVYACGSAGGMTAANVDGVSVSITVGVPIPVKAGHVLTVTWSVTAPTFGIYPQQ